MLVCMFVVYWVGPQHHQDHAAKEKALQTMSSMSSAQIVSAAAAMHPAAGGKTHHHVHHMAHHLSAHLATSPISNNHHHPYPPTAVVAQAPPVSATMQTACATKASFVTCFNCNRLFNVFNS